MGRITAIAKLTLKAAFRFRLVWILAALLFVAVGVLPVFLKDVGRAQDLAQLLLTYTLSATLGVLGFATLWLACGTLARDIEECQLQMVAVKPVARWEIWAGKWIGIMLVNLLLMIFAGLAIFSMLFWRVTRLDTEKQQELHSEVLVARGALKEPVPDFAPMVEEVYKERIKQGNVAAMDREFVRKQIQEQVKQEYQLVRPGSGRRWKIPLGLAKTRAQGQPLFIRAKFSSSEKSPTGTFIALWQVGVPESPKIWRQRQSLAPDAFHQFEIPPDLFDDQGNLFVDFYNPNETSLLFQIEDGLEILYPESTFGLNFVRALSVLYLWLGLLAAIGLAASSLLSFPVAAFFSVGLLVMVFSSGTMAQALEQGSVWEINHETGLADSRTPIDYIILPAFKGALELISLVEEFSPIDSISTGRSITWKQLGHAFVQIWVMIGGVFGVFGMITLTRRELAAPQGTN